VTTATNPLVTVGLVGENLKLSLSPALHEREGGALGFDYRYRVFDTTQDDVPRSLGIVLELMAQEGFAGSNITHPFKRDVLPILDKVDETAEIIGAVNTVVFNGSGSTGYNTDWVGFLHSLLRNIPRNASSSVVQLGAGGAGAAVAYALAQFGVKDLTLMDIDTNRAKGLADRLESHISGTTIHVKNLDSLEAAVSTSDGVVNATQIGMDRHPGLPLPANLITQDRWFHDVVYMPLATSLVLRATQVGAKVAGGGDMLVFQAARAINLFTGASPDTERMRQHFAELVDSGAQQKLAEGS
jgi:shikimate dehydrogenase